MAVARRLRDDKTGPPLEILCVDSMLVYRGMDIGTAKPSAADQADVSHHLIDLAKPDEEFSLVSFQQEALAALERIEGRGHRALIVGGTGLYFQAIVDRLTPPAQYPEVRADLEAEPDTAALHRRLSAVDPLAATRMLPTNRRRVIRALEVTLGSGRPFSTFGPGLRTYAPTRFRIAGLWLPRPVIGRRTESRFEAMLAAGLVDEVRRLLPDGLSRTARQALGYREVLLHLEEGVPLADAAAEAIRRTRAFARRQRMWWRRDPRITWFGAAENPLAVVPALLGDWSRP